MRFAPHDLRLTPLRIAIVLGVVLSGLRFAGCRYLELADVRAVDYRLLQRGVEPASPDVIIVGIDDASVEEFGRWPWSRDLMARFIDDLMRAEPAVIGFDIVQSEATAPAVTGAPGDANADHTTRDRVAQAAAAGAAQDAALVTAVRQSGRSVLGYFFEFNAPQTDGPPPKLSAYNAVLRSGAEKGAAQLPTAALARTNLPALTEAARETGFFNFLPDADGACRRVPLAVRLQDQIALPLSLSVLRAYRSTEPMTIRLADFGVESVRVGALAVPVAEDGQMLINYRGPGQTFRHISATDVLNGRLPAGALRGKIVLVGVTAAAVTDVRVTPFDGVMPGVEIHANVLDNILRQDFIWQPRWIVLVEIGVILIAALLLGAVLQYARGVSGALVVVGLLAAYLVSSQWLFVSSGLPLSLVYPLLAIALTYSAISVQHYVSEESEKRKIRDAFSLYLSPSLAQLVSERPEMLTLGGDKRELTVLFSDIRGFTTMSEGLEPEQLVEILNEFLGDMTDVIFAHDGTLDKYIGDAIMAVWGAPVPQADHAKRACRAALGMVERLHVFNERALRAGRPALDIGIGLNTGPMVVGNMGSARRLSYTVIGDNVNLGSRLEGLNKLYGTRIIVSETTLQAASDVVVARELDLVRVKGKRLPVRIFEILGRREDSMRCATLIEQWDRGIRAYRERRWDDATAIFETVLRDYPNDGPARLYLERCAAMQAAPPGPDWDGVTIMESK